MTYDFKKETEEVQSTPVIWELYNSFLLEPDRPRLKFWVPPSFPVRLQQLLNFSKVLLPSNLYSEDNMSSFPHFRVSVGMQSAWHHAPLRSPSWSCAFL